MLVLGRVYETTSQVTITATSNANLLVAVLVAAFLPSALGIAARLGGINKKRHRTGYPEPRPRSPLKGNIPKVYMGLIIKGTTIFPGSRPTVHILAFATHFLCQMYLKKIEFRAGKNQKRIKNSCSMQRSLYRNGPCFFF